MVSIVPFTESGKCTEPFVADIEIKQSDTGTNIQGIFKNNSSERVKFVYRLTMHKRGKAGKSSSNQGGLFTAEPEEKKILSQLKVNIQEGDAYSINLKIYHGQELMAEKFIRSSFDI